MAVKSEMSHMDWLASQSEYFLWCLNFPSHKFKPRSSSPGHLVPPSDGNNILPASRGSNPLAVVADFEHRSNVSNDARPLQGVAAA